MESNKMNGTDKVISVFIICFWIGTIVLTSLPVINNYIKEKYKTTELEQRIKVLEEILNEEHI